MGTEHPLRADASRRCGHPEEFPVPRALQSAVPRGDVQYDQHAAVWAGQHDGWKRRLRQGIGHNQRRSQKYSARASHSVLNGELLSVLRCTTPNLSLRLDLKTNTFSRSRNLEAYFQPKLDLPAADPRAGHLAES